MIGIYKITNIVTNQCYIGKSNNIKRRWCEHKTPKAHGNNKLHDDMKIYGIENFIFEVLEECNENDLPDKELFYIHNLKPYYNTIGKEMPNKTKKKVSEGTKKWWEALPKSKKAQIINNNLTGPKKGHIVTQETRQKISKKVSEVQKQKVRCIETGIIYNSVWDFEKAVGACKGSCWSYWHGKIKSVKGYHVEKV